jgi:tRNA (guanine37-N1)-methyltransferase
LRSLESSKKLDVIPYDLQLNYDSWDYHDIMTSVLPLEEQGEVPSGFSIVGHVAHLNLRNQYLPYKSLIADVLIDKNPQVKTVINKIDDVGAENPYRTFAYEILAGPDDLNVEVKEEDCFFRFDYAKVYWNPRLHAEHKRLVALFDEGDAVCDIMAGVGPFAVPAARKKVFVWANDLNPDSYASLEDAIQRNKVTDYVRPTNTDGRRYIVDATRELYHATEQKRIEILSKTKSRTSKEKPRVIKTLIQPRFFKHYIMNLPASALSFLPSFVGLYTAANIPQTEGTPLPKIHAYCFSTKSDDNVEEGKKICAEITEFLGREMKPGKDDVEGEVGIVDVRDVAPNKRMFLASFMLPRDVAWAELSP